MTTTPHGQVPEALMQLADAYAEASFDQGLHKRRLDDAPESARSVLEAELRRLHAYCQELEAQLESSGFGAADMATAAAQGFRDGVASLAASAGEPVAWYVTGCARLLDEYEAKAEARHIGGTARAIPVYTAPPTAQAEGWISVDERLPDEAQAYGRESDDCLVELPNKRFTCAMVVRTTSGPKWLDQDSRVVYPVRWMRIPPTSAEGVEHG